MSAREKPPVRWVDGVPSAKDGEDVARARALLLRTDEPRASAPARARVFARVEASTRARSGMARAWAWGVSGALVGAIAVLLAIKMTPPEPVRAPLIERVAEITSLSGNVHAGERAEPLAIARVGQRVRSGARVKTNAASTSEVRVFGIGALSLEADTELSLELDALDRGAEVNLQAGSMLASVEPAAPARTVAVVAGKWIVRVVGTEFRVARDGAEDVEVEVMKGIVDVDGPGKHVRLHAGERFASRQRVAATPAPIEEEELEQQPAKHHSTRDRVAKTLRAHARRTKDRGDADESSSTAKDRRNADERSPGTSAPRDRDDANEMSASNKRRDADERSAAASATKDRGDTGKSTRGGSAATADDARSGSAATADDARSRSAATANDARSGSAATAGDARSGSAATANDARSPRTPSDVLRSPDNNRSVSEANATPAADDLYAAAQRETNPLRAIDLFDSVAAKDTPLAEIAAHQAARLTMRIGKCTDASARFERLLSRYPSSAYAPEARLNILECHIRLGELDLATKDLESFLAHHPTSERSPELRFLRAELRRMNGDPRAAIKDYDAAIGSRRDADARYFKGWCELEIGATSAARDTLSAYLDRYPEGRHADHAREALERLGDRANKKDTNR